MMMVAVIEKQNTGGWDIWLYAKTNFKALSMIRVSSRCRWRGVDDDLKVAFADDGESELSKCNSISCGPPEAGK